MKRYSLYSIIFWISGISLLVSAVLICLLITGYKRDLLQAAVEEKLRMAEVIKETITSPAWLYRLSVLGDLERSLIVGFSGAADLRFIRLIDKNGEIYQSTFREEIGGKSDFSSIKDKLQSGQYVLRDDVFRGEKIKTIIYPGYLDQVIIIGFATDAIKVMMEKFAWRYFFVVLAVLFLAGAILLVLIQNIIKPIREITANCDRLRQGDFKARIEIDQKNEIGELAKTFNSMIASLRDYRQNLEESKQVLEIRVAARTRELEELADNLEKQVQERTESLRGKMTELERFNRLAVDRELKMIELKKELEQLKNRQKSAPNG